MSWTFTTSGSAVVNAGVGANTTIAASGSALLRWSDKAEAYICVATRKDWLTDYNNLSAMHKLFLADITDDFIAREIVKYDKTYYQAETEQQTILDVLTDKITKAIEILRDDKNKSFS